MKDHYYEDWSGNCISVGEMTIQLIHELLHDLLHDELTIIPGTGDESLDDVRERLKIELLIREMGL